MKKLQDKIAIVTGAAGGIGKSIAKLFSSEGAKVMATDVQVEKLKQWVETESPGSAIGCTGHDVTSEEDWNKVVAETVSRFGPPDILINNAGIFPGFGSCENISMHQWLTVINTNLTGPFLGCRTCIPYMRKKGGGVIVNISSIAGIVGGNGPAYSASKGGLRLLSKDLAIELAKDNIRVNAICPGAVITPMTESLLKQPAMEATIKGMSAQGRAAQAEEIAYGALFLASADSSFMTGADMVMDGGAVAR